MMDTKRIDDVRVSVDCIECHQTSIIPMTVAQEQSWRRGTLIQNVLPDFVQREILISGYCDGCFDELFSDDEEMV